MDVHIGCRKSLWSENLVIFLSGQWTHTRKAEEEKRKKKQSVVNLDEWSANTSRYMPAIPALERQGECESEAILDTLKRSCLKKKKKMQNSRQLETWARTKLLQNGLWDWSASRLYWDSTCVRGSTSMCMPV